MNPPKTATIRRRLVSTRTPFRRRRLKNTRFTRIERVTAEGRTNRRGRNNTKRNHTINPAQIQKLLSGVPASVGPIRPQKRIVCS